MIWLTTLGDARPISDTGKPIGKHDINIDGVAWKLYSGINDENKHEIYKVYSFVATKEVRSFKADLMHFVDELARSHGFPKSQVLKSVGAGTEPFTGRQGSFVTDHYSLVQM